MPDMKWGRLSELPALEGQARDEGMYLGVFEDDSESLIAQDARLLDGELLEKDLRVMLAVFKKDHRAEAQRRHKDMTVLVASMVQYLPSSGARRRARRGP